MSDNSKQQCCKQKFKFLRGYNAVLSSSFFIKDKQGKERDRRGMTGGVFFLFFHVLKNSSEEFPFSSVHSILLPYSHFRQNIAVSRLFLVLPIDS